MRGRAGRTLSLLGLPNVRQSRSDPKPLGVTECEAEQVDSRPLGVTKCEAEQVGLNLAGFIKGAGMVPGEVTHAQ